MLGLLDGPHGPYVVGALAGALTICLFVLLATFILALRWKKSEDDGSMGDEGPWRGALREGVAEPKAGASSCGWAGEYVAGMMYRVWRCRRDGETYELPPDTSMDSCPGCSRRFRPRKPESERA